MTWLGLGRAAAGRVGDTVDLARERPVRAILAGVFFHEPWGNRLPAAIVVRLGAWLLVL